MSSITIEKRGRRIVLISSEPLPGLRTTVPGAYQGVSGNWTVPLSLESCKLLREKYGKRLKIGSELSRWAQGIVSSRKYMSALAASDDAELHVVPKVAPRLYRAMRKRRYQCVGARFIADNHATLVADDPGLGKTLIAMAGIIEAQVPGPYLVVVSPKTATEIVWQREITRWLPPEHRAVTLPEIRYARERKLRLTRYGPTTWLIVHPEIVMVQSWLICERCGKRTKVGQRGRQILDCKHAKTKKTKRIDVPSFPRIFDIEWGAVIVDESHESLIRRSGNPTQRRRGLDLLRSKLRADGLPICLSGTPFNSKPHQLWGTLNWLDPTQYSAFHRWAELYWQKGGYTGFQIGEFRQDREGMLWDSLSGTVIRRTKLEVAPDLPAKMEIGYRLSPSDPESPLGIWLEIDGKQAKAYKEMEEVSVAELESGRLEAVTALAELTRLKQLACSYGAVERVAVKSSCQKQYEIARPAYWCDECQRKGWHREYRYKYNPELPSNKFDWICNNLEEWGYPKNPLTKVVVVSFYTGILATFAAGLEAHFKTKSNRPLCTSISGRIKSSRTRAQIIDRFNGHGNEHVMMLNIKAGGAAITIDSADRMIFISETRIPDQQKQAEDRIHRVSNPRQCMYYYLRSLGTVDVGTALVNQEAIRETHRLLDKRRGVEYMRRVLDLTHGIA